MIIHFLERSQARILQSVLISSFIETASEPIENTRFFESFAHPGVSRMLFRDHFAQLIFQFSRCNSDRDQWGGGLKPSKIQPPPKEHPYPLAINRICYPLSHNGSLESRVVAIVFASCIFLTSS